MALGVALLLAPRSASALLREEPASSPRARDGVTDERADPHRGPLGPVRLGALVGAGFPSLVSGQIVFKLHDWVGLTGSYGATPSISLPVASDASLSQHGFNATARVYPFRGAFFLGLGLGQSTVTGRAAESAYGVSAAASAMTRTTYVLPELGFLYRFSFGLTIGADIALQLPIAATSSSSASVAGTAVGLPDDVRQTLASLETTPVPVIHFLRIGFVL